MIIFKLQLFNTYLDSKKRIKFYGVLIKIRKALGLTQMLARFQTGENISKLNTAAKILKPFGLFLAIVVDKNDKVI